MSAKILSNELKKADYFYHLHKQAFGTWKEGSMKDCWRDAEGNLCICYESGKWWHYRENNGNVEWW